MPNSIAPLRKGGKMVTRLRNGGKTAQRNREESAACARPSFHQPTPAGAFPAATAVSVREIRPPIAMSPFLFGRPHVRSCEFSQERRKAGAECNSRRRLVMAPSSARTQEKLSLLSLLTRGGAQRETGLVQNHSLYRPIRPMSYTGFRVRRKSPVLATPCGRGQRGGTRRGKG